MIAELVENVSYRVRRECRNGEPEDALPRTGYVRRGLSGISKRLRQKNVRLPWIHNNEPVESHS
jgi:hypothetical protein